VPQTLLHATGLFDKTVDYVVSSLVPWCAACGCEATRPKGIAEYILPKEGVVAISIVDNSDEFSLKERCELLGVERAVVDGKLTRSADAVGVYGEPVLCVASGRDSDAIDLEGERWFSRGGGGLRILHFASRDAVGIELGHLQKSWACPGCKRGCDTATRAKLVEVPQCQSCKGQGWLEVADELFRLRQRACRECDGVGSQSEFFSYRFLDQPLKVFMCLSFAEFAKALHKDLQPQAVELAGFVARVCGAGFANYPLGAAVDLFSPGERSLLAALVGDLGMLGGTRYLLDAAYSAYPGEQDGAQEQLQRRLIVTTPQRTPLQATGSIHASLSEVVRLQDLNCGPLRISELAFPVGGLSAVQGPTGSGKSLLLELVATRFTKRRKLKHVSSFAGIERCTLISGLADSSGSVLELLGLTVDLAAEIARTRKAKELGLLEKELELPRSKFRCVECDGMGHTARGELCSVCQGALYDWRVAGFNVLGRSIDELVKAPIQELAGLLWTQTQTYGVVKLAAAHSDPALSLATPASNLTPSTRRFLKLLGGLGRYGGAFAPGSDKHSLNKELILIDGPHVMPDRHQQTLITLISGLQKRGATVLYAGIPESLEIMADTVLRLGFDWAGLELRSKEQFLDARYAQVAKVMVS
jgi:hypothetical protein